MTWSYTLPIAADLDRVRFLIGDTVAADPLLANEEIQYALDTYTDVKLAAACALRTLMVRAGSGDTVKIGEVSVSSSSALSDRWEILADRYDPWGLTTGATMVLPKFGGLSQADKDALLEDDDAVQPFFSREFDDIPGGSNDGS